ncbi:hypothetical protein [Pseudalkalibacillus decolorationis]|uniref:hypothetical protein n=1 Tax=Pseudalkalibacillus decolorationis TaxID=163879 RepID=UPI003557569B
MSDERFHCCASCIHFRTYRGKKPIEYRCQRLGFQTRPEYKFDCWNPKEQVKKLMEKKKGK